MRCRSKIRLIFALIIAGLASVASATEAINRAQYLGSYAWNMDKPWFGGWSGIELSQDGRQITLITDRGHLLQARVDRKGDQITAITPTSVTRLKASTGVYLTDKINDSEGLAIAADGTIYISFERVHRISRHTTPSAPAKVLPYNDAFRDLKINKSLEALAIAPDGTLYVIPEVLEGTKIQVLVLGKQGWSAPFTLTGSGGFLPVGADFGPDGRLYLLERAWGVFGFRARVRRWDIVAGQPRNEQRLLQTRTGTHDNLEGLAVWRDALGRTRLTMIADDNFMAFQRTELVDYVVTP